VSLVFGKKARRAAVLGAAGLGACAVLAACSPVQMGSAAIVGNQRITVSTVDTQVSDLQASLKQYNGTLQQINAELQQQQEQLPVFGEPLSRLVLNWQIDFALINQMAAADGISVTQAQGAAALASQAKSNSVSQNVYLTAVGIPLQMRQQAGVFLAQESALSKKYGSDSAAATKAQCTAAKALNIQISPQYGRFDYSSSTMSLVAGNDTLSHPAGTPSPANTEGLTPAAC
jgi:peptidoglycan hydrolase-like protein with peptidoglycan-binding domain